MQEAFDKNAADYGQLRRKFIPCFDDFYSMALALLPRPTVCGDDRPIPMLELGADTGLFSAMILGAILCAHLILADSTPGMLWPRPASA